MSAERPSSLTLVVGHGFETNYLVGFVRGLCAQGISPLVTSDDDSAARLRSLSVPHQNIRGSQGEGRSTVAKLLNLARYYMRLFILTARVRPQTLHFVGLLNSRFILLEGLLLPPWFRFCARRYIHTVHNTLPHGREHQPLFRAVYRWIYRWPHHFVAHTEKVAQQLQREYAIPIERISVISIGLNEEVPESSLSTADARTQLGLPADRPLILFFGKVEPYKGVDLVVEAWTQVRSDQAELHIVGACVDRSYAERINRAIVESPARARIHWHEGFVPNEEVALWLRACDGVVMPYRHIYQSGVVFLCLRHGVPIVATDVGSLRDYIDETSGVLAAQPDAASLAVALNQFLQRREDFDRSHIAGRAQTYRWEAQCALIKHLYE
jgi:glycosyltransferase involved in cell wall biosynthesis